MENALLLNIIASAFLNGILFSDVLFRPFVLTNILKYIVFTFELSLRNEVF